MLPEMVVSSVTLSPEDANAFANNPSAVDDSDLLIYKDAGSSIPEVQEKIQQALNSATTGKLGNSVSVDRDGNPVGSRLHSKLHNSVLLSIGYKG